MTNTITTTENTPTSEVTEAFVYLDPGVIVLGTNVRTDLRADKEFRKSIKERGVLEPVTVYRNDDGQYVLLRGQRRTVTAVEVGTPTGLIPAWVVPQPDEADRIGDQIVENIHRAEMREAEIVAGVEQLALIGASAAQITKRLSVPRPTVNAALAVTKSDQTRNRLESGDLTLEDAAVFAEFEHIPEAVERLERRKQWGHSLVHEAQRLRDEAAEQALFDAEVERLRGEGLPVLSGDEATEARQALRVERLRTSDDEPVPVEDWPNLPSAAVIVTEEWHYPSDEQTDSEGDDEHGSDPDAESEDDSDDEDDYAEPVKVYAPVWVVTDPAAVVEAGYVVPRYYLDNGHSDEPIEETDEQVEARRAERRRVIANNKAWASAETVRREWLAGFLSRKTAPKGAEALICEAVVTGEHSLYKAMEANHPRLRDLLGVGADKSRWDSHGEVAGIAAKATTPKASTMTTLAAVIAAWEDSTSKHTWRNPDDWDARVLGALIEWGYEASEVEGILIGLDDTHEADTEDDSASTDAAA
ncbi:chromosome partitioning protein, ParB family [Brevibacterium sp. Mu109]|uniref:ParB/RepB/Spo0J family partition protein n=1 Tax=Brevibacterium sp. Mu109 TaxID=1255669 RepID=UPI000C3817EE|nr:ParB/RepB/Spo0J family partition protein [Brevibacterium sp. Mu109]MDN5896330.1 ParB/RepB/Spo0J family partition protein [Nocardioides sp.]SMX87130.1 chromosome partitioning protein, ParB family [Brevibacterium sp. Mu109]